MTEQECIEWMEYLGNMKLAYDRSPNKRKTACDMAVKALEEIQQYRVLGTVEELRVARDKQIEEFCEWKTEKDLFIQNPHTKRKFSNEPSMKNTYCNTCGKKIKVV